jgi:hypothetical protein
MFVATLQLLLLIIELLFNREAKEAKEEEEKRKNM